jgi:hypothetical protein
MEQSQKEIESLLPGGSEYLVTNSEFDQIKARIAANREQAQMSKGDPSARW